MTNDCAPLFAGFEGLDILEGPPEITLNFEAGQVTMNTVAGKVCPPISGGRIRITAAKDIAIRKEADLIFRVRYKQLGDISTQMTYRYHVLEFPAQQQQGFLVPAPVAVQRPTIARPYVPSRKRRLTLDVASRVARIGRVEPQYKEGESWGMISKLSLE